MNADKEVLIVDDEEGVRVSWQRFLSQRGLKVTTADDGASAISQLSRRRADVVVSDLRMPGTDGLDVLKWLQEHQPDSRFILFTGYGNDHVERRAQELGAYSYLEKPVSPDVLADVIVEALSAAPKLVDEQPSVPEPELVPVQNEAPGAAKQHKPPPATAHTLLSTIGLLLAAPFLGLAYVVFLPVIGFGIMGWLVASEVKKGLWQRKG